MDQRNNKVIGIVGGMGPHAGVALMSAVLRHTGACADQQYLSTILMSFPGEVADRTLFLEGKEAVNPAFRISEIIKKLESTGAAVVGIACNTSHSPLIYQVILEELDRINSQVRMVPMPFETCRYIKENHPDVRRIGLMATNGTYGSGIYKDLLEEWGYDMILPDVLFQNDIIHRMIYDPVFGIKSSAGNITPQVRVLLDKALTYFKNRRADAVILGCTEFSLATTGKRVKGMLVIDSIESLAKALIREATCAGMRRLQL